MIGADWMQDNTKPPSKDDPFQADIQLVDASMKLAAFGASRGDNRRNYEWKLTYAVWALLTAAAIKGFVALPIPAGIIILFVYWSWLQNIWIRSTSDAEFTWHFANEAQRLLAKYGVAAVEPRKTLRIGRSQEIGNWRRWAGFLSNWSLRFQFLVALGLTSVVYFAAADQWTWIRIILKTKAN